MINIVASGMKTRNVRHDPYSQYLISGSSGKPGGAAACQECSSGSPANPFG